MTDTKNLWGGRFTQSPDKTFAEFNNSFRFDRRLFAADIRASIAHAAGLQKSGVLTSDESEKITNALRTLLERTRSDPAFLEGDSEDIHSFIESKLVDLVGEAGKKLHTGRSRNDQVATDFGSGCEARMTRSWKHSAAFKRLFLTWPSDMQTRFFRVTHTSSARSRYSCRTGVWLTSKCSREIVSGLPRRGSA